MTDWAIGDIQGCAEPFFRLLAKAQFDAKKDTLWVAGDLVNRGPDNLSVVRFVKNLGPRARIVLGNHDLHFLAVVYGARKLSPKDTLHDICGPVAKAGGDRLGEGRSASSQRYGPGMVQGSEASKFVQGTGSRRG